MSFVRYPHRYGQQRAKELADKLCEWLEATTSYVDLKEGLNRTWPNYDDRHPWKRFYQYGPVLLADENSVHDADGKPTGFKVDIKAVAYDHEVRPGDIITSGNGVQYIVQPTGALRRI